MRAALTGLRLATCGAKNQMNGSVSNPISAVNMRRTATLLFLKYFSTRYLSKWVETAQRTGPEKAKVSQGIDVNSRSRNGSPAPHQQGEIHWVLLRFFAVNRSGRMIVYRNVMPRPATGLIQVKVIGAKARYMATRFRRF